MKSRRRVLHHQSVQREERKKPYFTIKWVKNFLKKVKTFPTVRKVGNEKAVQDCVRRCEVSSLKHLFWISALISSPTRLLAPRAAPVSGVWRFRRRIWRFDIFLFGHGKLRVRQRLRRLRIGQTSRGPWCPPLRQTSTHSANESTAEHPGSTVICLRNQHSEPLRRRLHRSRKQEGRGLADSLCV